MLILKKSMFDYKIIFTSSYVPRNVSRKVDKNNYQNNSAYYRAKSKILDYAKNNTFNYFFTCTIDEKKFDITNHISLKSKLLKHFNNFKNRYDAGFQYVLVAEKGSKNNRLHFHGLINLNNTSFLKHIGRGIYRDEWFFHVFGANNWQKIKDYNIQCANYVCKYITKDEKKIYRYNYFCSRNLKISKVLARINYDRGLTTVYQKQLDFMYAFLSDKGLLQDYDFCSVATVDKEKFNEILIKYMYNVNFGKNNYQLSFNDLIEDI